ncbi:MAG: amino acid aminotransferase [Pseudomonadota bacterium]
METLFSALEARPPDPLLGISEALKADPRPNTVDLGVGIYKDEAGKTPVFAAVKAAEARLLETQNSKAYEGPRGNADFCAAIEDQVFGPAAPARSDGRTVSFSAPGGCGALFLAMSLAGRVSGQGRVWISAPSWPNHIKVAAAAGREPLAYPYLDAATGTLDFAALVDGLRSARPGDIVILQGPCHNPSGVDLTLEHWRYLGDFCARQSLLPLVDVAYHGFAKGLEADMAGVRAFLEACPGALVAYSCSKNFGLYRERAGCLIVQTDTASGAQAAASHVAEIARAVYSMPPAHGPAIVATILGDPELKQSWTRELTSMRERMAELRRGFADALNRALDTGAFAPLAAQSGMFSLIPIQGPAADALRLQAGIYMPGSGRINIAGLPGDDLDDVALRMAPFLALHLGRAPHQ